MNQRFHSENRHGSYTLTFEDGVICADVKGLFGDSLAMKFIEDMKTLADGISQPYWGYYANHIGCEGYTESAEQYFVQSHIRGMKTGCVVDAYIIESALAINQMERIKKRAGITADFRLSIFETEEQAKDHIKRVLQKVYRKAAD